LAKFGSANLDIINQEILKLVSKKLIDNNDLQNA